MYWNIWLAVFFFTDVIPCFASCLNKQTYKVQCVFANMCGHLSAAADRLCVCFPFSSLSSPLFFTSCSLPSLIYNGEREAGDKRGE